MVITAPTCIVISAHQASRGKGSTMAATTAAAKTPKAANQPMDTGSPRMGVPVVKLSNTGQASATPAATAIAQKRWCCQRSSEVLMRVAFLHDAVRLTIGQKSRFGERTCGTYARRGQGADPAY